MYAKISYMWMYCNRLIYIRNDCISFSLSGYNTTMKKNSLKQYYVRGVSYYAHSEDEAFERYKKDHLVAHGEIFHIGNKFFRVIGEKIHELLKAK